MTCSKFITVLIINTINSYRELRIFPAEGKRLKTEKFKIRDSAKIRKVERIKQEEEIEKIITGESRIEREVKGKEEVFNINDLKDDDFLLIFSHIPSIIDRTNCEKGFVSLYLLYFFSSLKFKIDFLVCRKWNVLMKQHWEHETKLNFTPTFFSFGAPGIF